MSEAPFRVGDVIRPSEMLLEKFKYQVVSISPTGTVFIKRTNSTTGVISTITPDGYEFWKRVEK